MLPLKKKIIDKADSLKIERVFLLTAIYVTAKWNGMSLFNQFIEEKIKNLYFEILVQAATRDANEQLESDKKSLQEAGSFALKKFDLNDLLIYGVELSEILWFTKEMEIKYLHVVVIKRVLSDIKKFKSYFTELHIAEIITKKFNEEVEQMKINLSLFNRDELSGLFSN